MSDQNFRNFVPGIELVPQPTSNVSSQGDLDVDTTSGKINYHNGTTSSHIVTETQASEGASRLQNKDLDASNVQFVDSTDTTKKLNFSESGATTGTELTLAGVQSSNQTLTFPNAPGGDTVVTNNTVATLTNKIISGSNNTITNIPASAFTGTLPIANGGTNATTAAAAYNNLSPMTTTGDMEYEASAGVAARLPIGSSGQVLTVSGGIPSWQTSSPGFTNPMTSVGDMIIGGTAGAATRLAAGTNTFILTMVSGSPAWQANSGGSAPTSIGALDGQAANANGLTIASNVLYAQSADATHPGMVNNTTQTFSGAKTFSTSITTPVLDGVSNHIQVNSALDLEQISTPSNPSSGYNSIYVKSDGNLYILNSSGVETLVAPGMSGSDWKNDLTFTPSAGFGKPTNVNVWYRRVGDTMEVKGSFTTGTTAASLAYITLPGGYTIDTSKWTATTAVTIAGRGHNLTGSASSLYDTFLGHTYFYNGVNNDRVNLAILANTDVFATTNAEDLTNPGQVITFEFAIPITGWTTNNGVPGGVSSLNTLTGALTIAAGSGITVTPSGGNTLTVDATGGSGANTALSNLASVAVNTSLLPASDASINLGSSTLRYGTTYTEIVDSGLSTLSLISDNIASGSSATAAVSLKSGNQTGSGLGQTGNVTISTGGITNISSGNVTGDLTLSSGSSTGGGGVTGTVTISSGNGTTGSISGDIIIATGTGSGVIRGGVYVEGTAISLEASTTIGETSTTPIHSLNTALATNGSGTATLTNLPSGFSGNPTGYISININGSPHILPYW